LCASVSRLNRWINFSVAKEFLSNYDRPNQPPKQVFNPIIIDSDNDEDNDSDDEEDSSDSWSEPEIYVEEKEPKISAAKLQSFLSPNVISNIPFFLNGVLETLDLSFFFFLPTGRSMYSKIKCVTWFFKLNLFWIFWVLGSSQT
jgi:hypothetical protein